MIDAAPARRVLLVEDERVSANLYAIALESGGFDVELAASAEEAFGRIRTRRFDLVVLDLYFPGTGGWELLSSIRERHSTAELPIIMLSSEPNENVRASLLALGANDFLTKPVAVPTLLKAARDCIEAISRPTEGKLIAACSKRG
ncbi:MAG TPA: response regulator [Stellaceae bacterium]|nr:response regulator [Stellaceae bacterium]